MMVVFWQGFMISIGLILAIGAQNSFILRQGLKREYIFTIVMISLISDAILITIGVFALASIQAFLPNIAQIMRWLGGSFLLIYGMLSFWKAFKQGRSLKANQEIPLTVKSSYLQIILFTLAITWLNPHVYLDTMFLIGSYSLEFPTQKLPFTIGAISASAFFFFSLGYGATFLSPILAKPKAWVIIDCLIGGFMLFLGISLIL